MLQPTLHSTLKHGWLQSKEFVGLGSHGCRYLSGADGRTATVSALFGGSSADGVRRHFPTFTKVLPKADPTVPEPSVLLFYGPGGMGKTISHAT
ncbi:MAG: hypothetical protein HC812_15630, partial [Leptolyngbya sp. RL_3_1]|nr:hypothetical protein [Leptolyngbya sp. RL_3_1]